MKLEKKKQTQGTHIKSQESLTYTVEVRDKEGRLLKRISAPSRSYVQQWNQMICSHAKNTVPGGPYVTIMDTSGVNKSAYSTTSTLGANAPIGTITYGIRVGKGATAVAITDYALENPLGQGSGLDQFRHQVMEFATPSVVGSTCSFTIRRVMVNDSGATISGIREIGCYVTFTASATTQYAMGFRDVLPSALEIPDGGSITVTYTLSVTV